MERGDSVDDLAPSRPDSALAPSAAPVPSAASAASGRRRWIHEAGLSVAGGHADLFAHRAGSAGEATKRHFVARIPAGSVIPQVPAGPLVIEAVALPGATLRDIPEGPPDAGLARGIDAALLAIADSVRALSGPRNAMLVQPGQILSAAAGTALRGNAQVWWLRILGGAVRVNGTSLARDPASDDLVVLSGRDWLEVEQACTIETLSSMDLLSAGLLEGALSAYLGRLLDVIAQRIGERDTAFLAAIADRKKANQSLVSHAAQASLGAVGVRAAQPAGSAQAQELRYRRIIALLALLVDTPTAAGLAEPARRGALPASDEEAIREVARKSALHLRDVELSAGWHRRDVGPLIGWQRAADDSAADRAVALVFRRGRYQSVDPVTGTATRLNRARAGSLRLAATQVQVPLPAGSSTVAAFRLGLAGVSGDVRGLLLAGVIAACLGLAVPLVTGAVLGQIAENLSSTAELRLLPAALIVAAVLAALATVAQNLHLLRLEGRIENGTQLALWDRLIRLPVTFFRSMNSGELANGVLGISYMREALSGISVAILSAALTAVLDLILILVLSPELGLAALAIMVLCTVATWILGIRINSRGHRAVGAENRTTAFTNKLLSGIAKIKIAGAEDRAYAQWSQLASGARANLISMRRVQAMAQALSTALPIAGELVLFLVLAGPLAGKVGASAFFMISVSFATLLGSLLLIMSASVEILAVVPRLAAFAPIVAAEPEHRPDLVDPGDLEGEISLVGVSFSYRPDTPLVLDNLNLQVRPGEFVAVVGPSGCGKSTMLRLLLGFENPTSGAVLYDGQDLADLDPQAVRRQCGIVLQGGALFAGSIRENIAGAGKYSLEQVWQAAALAGVAKDIEEFPMQMSTYLPVGGGTLSGGQRQRVLIARAMIHQPRVLFFDEATSALDNRTQEIVTESTRSLAATRLVIAHRLSTIIDADRIVVMDKGSIVQQGTFAELMDEPDGLFFRLASRQLLTGVRRSARH
jgi:NHLM bacteriocin system ABC transporter ATP-binding protein